MTGIGAGILRGNHIRPRVKSRIMRNELNKVMLCSVLNMGVMPTRNPTGILCGNHINRS